LAIDFFNPVVSDWTPECQQEEIKQRETCEFTLYVITPQMEGVYSIAEAVDDSNKRPEKVIFCVLIDGDNGAYFTDNQKKSLAQVSRMILRNGGEVFDTLVEVANYINASG
jgi:hypothetical protein